MWEYDYADYGYGDCVAYTRVGYSEDDRGVFDVQSDREKELKWCICEGECGLGKYGRSVCG